MKANLYTKTGATSKTKADLDDAVFGLEVNQPLLDQAVYVYLSNQRQANAHTKDRSAVRGGGKKPWRQKGTGRARHGSNRSPIWTGGGVTFGPSNDRNFKKSLSKKMKKQAIKTAFSAHAKAESLFVFDEFDTTTSKVTAALDKAGVAGKTLIVQEGSNTDLLKAARNIKDVSVVRVGELSPYTILNCKQLVLTKASAEKIAELWGANKPKTTSKKTDK